VLRCQGPPAAPAAVRLTTRGPLYFQHEGHSRTVVGIERRAAADGAHAYSLLVLDPGGTDRRGVRRMDCIVGQADKQTDRK
jgi:Peptidase family C78